MIGSNVKSRPVLDDGTIVGVVSTDAILEGVREYLDAVTVEAAYSTDLISASPTTSIGEALNILREAQIAHLPVLDDAELVGMLSLYDVVEFTIRGGTRTRGGSPAGGASGGGRGGYGERGGDSDRLLDLPVRNLMSGSVATIARDAPLDEAVEIMFEKEISSLVVTDSEETPLGIITKTDVIEALPWEPEDQRNVQVFGLELLEGMDHEAVASLIDDIASKYGDMTVIKASIELQEHKEQTRGVPLILARIRLVTDKGYFTADGEGYGAAHAIRLAANAVEQQVLKGKTYGQTMKRRDDDEQRHIHGWWLGG